MKVVFEIAEEMYNDALDGKFNVTAFNEAIRKHSKPLPTTSYCINIPEGATNGDVIKIMFPHIKTFPSITDSFVKVYNLDSDNCEEFELFSTDWWNAPYKTESES